MTQCLILDVEKAAFYLEGIGKLGGVKYNTNLYETALSNMQKVKLESTKIIHFDAAKVSKALDKYNYFLCIIHFTALLS